MIVQADYPGIPRQHQMLTIEPARHNAVERIVVKPCQPQCPLLLRPQPLLEFLLERLLLLACRDGFLLVDHALVTIIGIRIVHGRHCLIQRLVEQGCCIDPLGSIRLRSCYRQFGTVMRVDIPRACCLVERHGVSVALQSFIQKCFVIACRYPGGPDARTDFAWCQIIGNHGFQRLRISAVTLARYHGSR